MGPWQGDGGDAQLVLLAGTPSHAARQDVAHLPGGPWGTNKSLEGNKLGVAPASPPSRGWREADEAGNRQ